MVTLPIGILLIISIVTYSLLDMNMAALVNTHSILIVCFGTIGVLLMSTPLRSIIGLVRSIKDLRRSESPNQIVNTAILNLAKNRYDKQAAHIHPLINYAQDLWEQGLDINIFGVLLTQRLEELNARSEQPVHALRNLAKYPPALGMTGTVIGMIALFGSLNAENKSNIGANLAFAMTATFFGLILANFILLPIADRIHIRHIGRVKRNELVYHSLLLINQNEPVSVVENCHRVNEPYKESVA
jgi:chemotaxis protein MotA